MRGWSTIAAVGVLVGGTCGTSHAQIGLFLASGTGNEPTTSAAYWVSAPATARAAAVAEIVVLSQNPLNGHLVMLAAGGQTRELPPGIQEPPIPLPAFPSGGATIFGGNAPGSRLGGAPGSNGGGGGGGGSGSGGGSGDPRVKLAVTPPTDTLPGSVGVTATTADGFPLGTGVEVPIPIKGWWTLGTDPGPFLESGPGGGTENIDKGGDGPPKTDPEPGPGSDPGPGPGPGPGGGPADTPEPTTAVLALVGASLVGATRLRRRPS